jgi:putative ABC transport system ATP-binding protein
MIEFKNVTKSYAQPILSIPELTIPDKSQFGVFGPSGTGKTTFLHLISGLILPTTGQIHVAGTDITTLKEAKRDVFRANHVGYIFQTFNLVEGYSALENVMLGQVFLKGKANREKAADMLEKVGLADRMNHKPSELSVGQQQRVSIARALVNDPDILLADEPTGSLDAASSASVMDLILSFSSGRTLLLVSHDPNVLDRFSERISLLEFQP